MTVQRRLAAILAADVAGYSRLMGEDEEGTLAALTAHRTELIDPRIAEHNGRIVKTTGDGLLAEFASVVDAVRCAVALQKGMTERNAGTSESQRIDFRIGVNLGDVIIQDEDVFGDGVNIASRLEGLAEPGGICISDTVHQNIRTKLEVSFDDLGPQRVKNIGEPVRAFHARRDALSPSQTMPMEAPPLPAKPSIAVLPFENMSPDAEQEYFSDGITEDIITELSKISGLFVIARHSAFTYKGKSLTLKQVGRELGVRYVLEGSVRKAGNRLRITAQLIDATTDHHLWAERYDRELEDIFAVQDEVARNVADALSVTLQPDDSERLAHIPTQNIDSYDMYLRERMPFLPPARTNTMNARSAYARIIDNDPSFAGGYAGKSITHSIAAIYGHGQRPEEDTRIALELAEQAMMLDDRLGLSHTALAFAHIAAKKLDEAVAAARRAVELQPGDADSHMYLSACLTWASCGEEARDAALTALRLDPQYVAGPYYIALGRACYIAERHAEAVEAYETNVSRGGPVSVPMLSFWAASLVELDQMERAKEIVDQLLELEPSFTASEVARHYWSATPEQQSRIISALRTAGVPD